MCCKYYKSSSSVKMSHYDLIEFMARLLDNDTIISNDEIVRNMNKINHTLATDKSILDIEIAALKMVYDALNNRLKKRNVDIDVKTVVSRGV